jgi:hypothetical protein
MDKNRAIIAYLQQCPHIQDNPLFFNFADQSDGNNHLITNSDKTKSQYIDGSALKIYTFTIACYKDVAYNPLGDYDASRFDENIENMAIVQDILNWIERQSYDKNYPDFGEGYQIDDIRVLTNDPNVGVDTSTNPPLARYSISIEIEYLDNTKKFWT